MGTNNRKSLEEMLDIVAPIENAQGRATRTVRTFAELTRTAFSGQGEPIETDLAKQTDLGAMRERARDADTVLRFRVWYRQLTWKRYERSALNKAKASSLLGKMG